MDPLHSAQDVSRCDLCETPVPHMYCDMCHINLCKACVGEHLVDASKEHKVVPFEKRGSTNTYPKCQKHSMEICQLQCKQCHIPICILCVSSGEHEQHKKGDFLKTLAKKKEILKKDLQELENSILPNYKEAASNISYQKTDKRTRSKELSATLKRHGEVLHKEIDIAIQKMQSKIDSIDAQYMAALNKKEIDISHIIEELSQVIVYLNKLQQSSDFEYTSRNEEFRRLPAQVQDPACLTLEISKEQIYQLCGWHSVITQEDHSVPLQEGFDSTRQALNEANKQNHGLLERVQGLQKEVADSDVRRAELEGQLRQSHTMLVQRQQREQDLNQNIQKISSEKQLLHERVQELSRQMANLETEKSEMEPSSARLKKDKSALKKIQEKVEREKLRTEEMASKSVLGKGNLDRTLNRLEDDNTDLQKQVQQLKAQLAEAEQQHAQRLIDLTTRHRAESEMETERLRSAQTQAERMLETRERAHRAKVKGLEETVAILKDQLATEMRKRQDEIRDIRNISDNCQTNDTRDQSLEPLVLETETRKLDDSMNFERSYPSQSAPRRRLRPGRDYRRYGGTDLHPQRPA